MSVIGGDIQETTGSIQLCSGQASSIEAGNKAYRDDNVQAILLVNPRRACARGFVCFFWFFLVFIKILHSMHGTHYSNS